MLPERENEENFALLYGEQQEYQLKLCQRIQAYDMALAMLVAAEFGIVDDFRRQQ